MLTEQELMREAAKLGFQKEPLEKVIRLPKAPRGTNGSTA